MMSSFSGCIEKKTDPNDERECNKHIRKHCQYIIENGIHYVTTGAAGGKMGAVGKENQFEVAADQIRTMVQIQASSTLLYADIIGLDGNSVDTLILKK